MFVRWKARPLTGSIMRDPTKSLTAVLVESKRVGGRPRQRFVTYLGRIHEELPEEDSHCPVQGGLLGHDQREAGPRTRAVRPCEGRGVDREGRPQAHPRAGRS